MEKTPQLSSPSLVKTIASKIVRRLRYYYDYHFGERILAENLLPILYKAVYPKRQRARPEPATVKSVLVWNIDSLGDSVWTTPSLRALRAGYANAKITLLCNRACADLVRHNPNIDEVIAIDPRPYYQGPGWLRRVTELEGRRFDVMVVLEMGSRPADAGRLLGRRLAVGYLVSSDLGILKHLPDHTLPPNKQEYWPAYFMRAAEALGIPPALIELEIPTSAEDTAAAVKILQNQGWPLNDGRETWIGLHPCVASYGSLTKMWPHENFLEVARIVAANRPTRFLITGSRDEAGPCENLAQRIRETTGAPALSTAGLFSVRELVTAYKTLDALVVGDTAALHFAAAAKTPTIAIFGATNPQTIAPDSALRKVMTISLPCRPCHQNRDRLPFWPKCIFPAPKCLLEIRSEQVAQELFLMLDQPKHSSPAEDVAKTLATTHEDQT